MVRSHVPRDIHRKSDRGSVTVETVIVTPGLLLIIALLIVGGRITLAHGSVEHAAEVAARTATLARSSSQAESAGEKAGRQTLKNQKVKCISPTVDIDPSGFDTEVGTPGAVVTATVVCEVDLSDIALPGLPGKATIRKQVESPLDTYRERE